MIPSSLLDTLIDRALEEDLHSGDITTESTVRATIQAVGRAVARSNLVVAGTAPFARTFHRVDPMLRVEAKLDEGNAAKPGDVLFIVEGSARSILMGERVALNFVQRLSGVATLARRYVEALPPGSRTRITDTRKTTPGLRSLERDAVRAGGAHNHRNDLGSAVLIKDNHIDAAGGIRAAVASARQRAPHTSRIEVEVPDLAALAEALEAGADIVMLDNFARSDLASAVTLVSGRALIEVSGGITLERVRELAALGVDIISVGALTHSAPAADIALDLEPLGGDADWEPE